MKEHFERYGIYYLIGMIILIGIVVCFVAYRPAVGSVMSDKNVDWGNFGDFFWGFGVMCFSALNVYVFWRIQQQMLRDSLVRDLRTLVTKIREAQDTNNKKIFTSRIESFKFAVGPTMESGLLSKQAVDCIKRLMQKLAPEQLNIETAPYYCEAIIYTLSINKNIDNVGSRISTDIGLMEKIHHWEQKKKDIIEDTENINAEDVTRRSFADYLQDEMIVAKRLSAIYPKSRVYLQKSIPGSDLIMDALMVPREGGKEVIVEIISRLSEHNAQKAVHQLLQCRHAYQKAYNKEPNLAVIIMEDPKKYLSRRVTEILIENEFNKHGISYFILKNLN